ncbi:hypothetical protein Tco_0308872 [Tanacetum coccineum]|uniref:Uncharacterized protein n=1 Tax=Tanacetum coccineum TaxID=301880 RepID=A0ABQ5A5G0_9ASTR
MAKDHPLDNIVGNPSRPVSTRKQLASDALCSVVAKGYRQEEGIDFENRLLQLQGIEPSESFIAMRNKNRISIKWMSNCFSECDLQEEVLSVKLKDLKDRKSDSSLSSEEGSLWG